MKSGSFKIFIVIVENERDLNHIYLKKVTYIEKYISRFLNKHTHDLQI